ncbi:MAG: D-alanyl-D-alanine carboxypeptidase family protein [Oscillospiraceae bacterium]
MKIISILLSISLIFPLASAAETDTIPQDLVSAKTAILMEMDTGEIIYEKNSHEKMPPASITKIMTLLLAMEALDSGKISYTDIVTASTKASKMGGSQIWLKENETMCLKDIVKAVTVASANDAAMALAEHIAGSEDAFVNMMNQRAKELGMNDTTFLNPTGLDEKGHLSSAYDIAIMSKELLKHKSILEFTTIWMDSLRDGKTQLVNTNKLVRFYKNCTGLKTGTTDGAGSCVSATANKNNIDLVAVVMGCSTSKDRFNDARALLDFGFSNYKIYTPQPRNIEPIKVKRGVKNSVIAELDISKKVLIPSGKEVTEEFNINDEMVAPINIGDVVGNVKLYVDGNLIAQYDIKSKENIEKLTFFKAYFKLLRRLIEI